MQPTAMEAVQPSCSMCVSSLNWTTLHNIVGERCSAERYQLRSSPSWALIRLGLASLVVRAVFGYYSTKQVTVLYLPQHTHIYTGMFTSGVLAGGLGLYLTPMPLIETVPLGWFLSAVGFLGDVTMSAVKRDLGIKDASHLLPGHGGILCLSYSYTYRK